MHQTVPFILDQVDSKSLHNFLNSSTDSAYLYSFRYYNGQYIFLIQFTIQFGNFLSGGMTEFTTNGIWKHPLTHGRFWHWGLPIYRWHIKKVTSLQILFTGLLNRIHCGVILCGNNFTVFIFRDADSLGLFFIMWISVENKFAYLPFKQWISWCLQVK